MFLHGPKGGGQEARNKFHFLHAISGLDSNGSVMRFQIPVSVVNRTLAGFAIKH